MHAGHELVERARCRTKRALVDVSMREVDRHSRQRIAKEACGVRGLANFLARRVIGAELGEFFSDGRHGFEDTVSHIKAEGVSWLVTFSRSRVAGLTPTSRSRLMRAPCAL